MIYPVITLHQPWASWIVMGHKTIETRIHSRFACLKGQTILIHAGKTMDPKAWPNPYLTLERPIDYPQGAILGKAFVRDFRQLNASDSPLALIDCGSVKRFGLLLEQIEQFKEPIPARGAQGIWYY